MNKNIKKRFEDFHSEYQQNYNVWREISNLFSPDKRKLFLDMSKGQYNYKDVFTSIPEDCIRTYASGMSNGLTPTTMEWFDLGVRTTSGRVNKEVNDYMSNAKDMIHLALADSNFYSVIEESHRDDALFGMSCIYAEDTQDGLAFSNVPVTHIAIYEDSRGKIYELIRKYKMRPIQYKKLFGKLPPNCKEDSKKDIEFYHHVYENDKYRNDKPVGRNNFPYISAYVYDEKVIEEGGYREMPYIVTRFNMVYGEALGNGIAKKALADARSLNQATNDMMYSAAKIAAPPVMLAGDDTIDDLDLSPNGVTYFNPSSATGGAPILPVPIVDNPQFLASMEEMIRSRVQSTMLYDVFLSVSQTAMEQGTATGISIAKNERLSMIGPNVHINETQKLRPLVERSLGLLIVNGTIPALSVETDENISLEVEYSGSLTRNLRTASKLEAIQAEMNVVGGLMNLGYEDVRDKLNPDAVFDIVSDAYSGGSIPTRGDEDVQGIREQRQNAMQAQLEAQALMAQSGEQA